MAAQQNNLKVLDSSISEQEQIKEEVLAEERENAEKNYGLLEQLINDQRKRIPFPDVSMFAVGIAPWKKSENQKYWDEMERIGKYAKCEKLYCGHLRFQKDEYYFTEDLRFKTFVSPDQRFFLINTEDKAYQDIRNAWTNPIKEKDVTFSRNIMMEKKVVTDVDIKFDSRSELLSNTKLLNICKRKMKEAVQLEDDSGFEQYKHYWYLCLYAHYLIYGSFNTHYPYIFIDEAQDLSPSEIELIYKINSIPSGERLTPPVINLFGDTNQAISMHSISDWDTLSIALEKYYLKENFRNTNQIVAYCNSCLPFHMQEVGVDMGEVKVFQSVADFIESKSSIAEGSVFIVKDQQSAEKLKDSIKDTANANYSVLTVKDSKGLEFRDVIVVDCGMSINEKYIAYTRALANLTIWSSTL